MARNSGTDKATLLAGFAGLFLWLSASMVRQVEAGSFQVSGGMDGRNVLKGSDETDTELEGLFLNVRKVFSDNKGDRLIAVGQLDLDRNFDLIRPYQTYLQYKGPLGRWNLRAGHYLLPFGLLESYDTERLPLTSLEPFSLGIKLDTGIEVLGFYRQWDYAASLSQGVGRRRVTDVDDDKLLAGRVGWDSETVHVGLSGLLGKVLLGQEAEFGTGAVYEKRLALDLTTKSLGPLTLRSEAVVGANSGEAGQVVAGAIGLVDYALTDKLELNTKLAHWQQDGGRNLVGAGISYQVVQGLFIRLADTYAFGVKDRNAFTTQVYVEFARAF